MSAARYHLHPSCRLVAQGLLVFLLLLSDVALLVPPALARPSSRPAQVIVETRLRAEPSKRGKPLLRIPAGTTITIKGSPEDGWYRAHHGRLDGYVRSGDVATDLIENEPALAEEEVTLQPGEAIDTPGKVALEQEASAPNSSEQSARSGKSGKSNARHDRKGHAQRGSKSSRKHDRKKQRKDARAEGGMQSTRVVAATDLNLRTDPDADAPVSATMPRGDQAMPTGEQQDGWVEVAWGDETGWALGRHLAVLPPAASDSGDASTTWSREELKEIIYDAADRYGQPREDMLRVARCESDMIPSAVNPYGGSYGLYQFKPGTWLSTPYAEYDIFDPRASANAAAWMWSVGRRREWVCQ